MKQDSNLFLLIVLTGFVIFLFWTAIPECVAVGIFLLLVIAMGWDAERNSRKKYCMEKQSAVMKDLTLKEKEILANIEELTKNVGVKVHKDVRPEFINWIFDNVYTPVTDLLNRKETFVLTPKKDAVIGEEIYNK